MSTIHHFTGDDSIYSWESVSGTTYSQQELQGITKYLLVGPADQANNFEVRLFQFDPGSQSDHVRHDKEYGFYILEGQARFKVNEDQFALNPKDAAYISAGDVLQIVNCGDGVLRFICVTIAA